MRALFLFALLCLLAPLPGCDNLTPGYGQPADRAPASPDQGGATSLGPLSGGGPGQAPSGSAPGYSTAPVGGGQPTSFVSEPYVLGEQPSYGAAPVQPGSGTRYPSPYDALFQGPYGNQSYAPQPYVTTVQTVPAPVTTTYPAPVTTYSAPVTTYPAPVTTYPAPTVTYTPAAPLTTSTYTETVVAPNPAMSYAPTAITETATVREVGGLQLVPATDIPPGNHPEDAAPSQWFEILRPGNGPIRIGRVSATCVCVGVRVPKRTIAAGERALIEARTLTKPPRNNLTYGIFVSVVEPQNVMLDTDVTIRY